MKKIIFIFMLAAMVMTMCASCFSSRSSRNGCQEHRNFVGYR